MKELIEKLREFQRSNRILEAFELLSQNPAIEFTDNSELKILYGIIKILSGEKEKGLEVLLSINPENLTNEEALSDYAFLLFLTHQPEEAINFLKKALDLNPNCFIAYARLSAIYLTLGNLELAEKYLIKALEFEPNRIELLSNLATLKYKQGKYKEALEFLNRAIKIDPKREDLYLKKSQIMLSLRKIDEYIEELYENIEKNPEDKINYIILANVLINAGRENEAISLIEGALDKFEEDEEIKKVFISIALKSQRYYLLGQKLKEWVEKEPDSIELRFLLNEARIECGFLEAAEKDLDQFPEEAKLEPKWRLLKAKILLEKNQGEKAVKLLEEAVEYFPGDIELRNQLAHILLTLGRKEEAKIHVEAVTKISPFARFNLIEYKDYEADEEEIKAMEKIIQNPANPLEERISLAFTLARVYEKMGEYDKSFEIVKFANELTKTIVRYDWREHRRYVQEIIEAFNKDIIRKLEGKGHPSKRPIFIVGMPRSGTTLVEQILAAHSQVYGAGELPWIGKITQLFPKTNGGYPYPQGIKYMDERHLKSAGEYYLKKLEIYDKTSPYVTDKLPHNFDHIGLIYLIFPNAAIIHVHRDPRDVAISNYYQNFAAMRGLMGFANDLKDIGHMLNDYLRIMQHWYEVLPPGKIFKVVYEELVSEPERVIRELLEYCGLSWEDNVLEFYNLQRPVKTASIQQVREKIYKKSKERWKKYKKHLKILFEILEEGFIPLE